uniref:PHD-type domain-containing protein n=1 Tax=Helicotheca tamesis TaxID=374047 RepID=A0A7S2HC63_9STRA|mmetsp:Transcript_16900/g.23172  ORF Transcript_16900/g.23172 Transcript_16900/m.23172 type:complete len:570 (+) Transcript_16900:109-1818(+)
MADTAVAPASADPPTSSSDANGGKEDVKATVNGEKEDAKPTDMEVEATDTATGKRSADVATSNGKVDDEAPIPVTPVKKRPKILDMELVDDDDEAEDFKPKKGQFCDVCFLPQDTGLTNLGKCKGCDLVVHSSCYEKKYLDETGHFKCDVCVAVKKNRLPKACLEATPKKGKKPIKKPRKVEDVVASPGPLPPKIEAVCDGREYPEPDAIADDASNIDPFCQLCLRRDVMGGMKPTDEGKWVHLACIMSTTDTWFDGSVVRGVTQCIKKNMKERMKKNNDVDPPCEACGLSGGFLVQCAHIDAKRSRGAKPSPKKQSPKKSTKKSPKKKKAPPPKPPTVYRGERKLCKTWLHPLCAEICERVRIIQKTEHGDVIHYKCAEHSYIGLDTCGICKKGSRQNEMIECDGCQRGYHMSCLTPPLEEVPEDDWMCNKCLGIPEVKEEPKPEPKPESKPEPEKPGEKEGTTPGWVSDGLAKPETGNKDETPEAAKTEEKDKGKDAEEVKEDEKKAEDRPEEAVGSKEDKPEEAVGSKETTTEPTADESEKDNSAKADKKDDEPSPAAEGEKSTKA